MKLARLHPFTERSISNANARIKSLMELPIQFKSIHANRNTFKGAGTKVANYIAKAKIAGYSA